MLPAIHVLRPIVSRAITSTFSRFGRQPASVKVVASGIINSGFTKSVLRNGATIGTLIGVDWLAGELYSAIEKNWGSGKDPGTDDEAPQFINEAQDLDIATAKALVDELDNLALSGTGVRDEQLEQAARRALERSGKNYSYDDVKRLASIARVAFDEVKKATDEIAARLAGSPTLQSSAVGDLNGSLSGMANYGSDDVLSSMTLSQYRALEIDARTRLSPVVRRFTNGSIKDFRDLVNLLRDPNLDLLIKVLSDDITVNI